MLTAIVNLPMPHTIETAENRAITVVKHFGHVLASEFEEVSAAIELIAQPGPNHRVLIDIRGIEGFPSKSEFILWLRNRRPLSPSIARAAIITDEQYADIVDFQVLASQNTGMTVERFTNVAEAMAWLDEQASS